MAKNKNTRVEQESWVVVRPQCHPESQFAVRHSMQNGIYSINCAQCGHTHFRIMVETTQW